jgi:hypothetical protein
MGIGPEERGARNYKNGKVKEVTKILDRESIATTAARAGWQGNAPG